jgi:hypothetical protein
VNLFFYSSVAGWIASILVAAESLLPYLLRRTAISEWLGTVQLHRPYRQRMSAHYWIGYSLVPLALVHAWIPMAAGRARGANMLGLWLATAALMLLFLQLGLGLTLKGEGQPNRRQMRGIHYWTMIAIAVAVAAHLWLNG